MASFNRRPIKARDTRWAAAIAGLLARGGVKPNHISIASAVFAAGSGICFALTSLASALPSALLFLAAALLIQARLLCNLFDGMVAIEGGFKTKSGEIFNELPDRFADAFIFVGAGFAAAPTALSPTLGWLCAVLAIMTAYVRALGATAGASQHFCGPMAKQHRMALMTFAATLSAILAFFGIITPAITIALAMVALGCLATIIRRTLLIIRELEST